MLDRAVALLGRAAFAVVWLVVAAAIAVGTAGLAAALDHEPSSGARPELTWAADSAVAPQLDAATTELAAISGVVDELGLQGRGALAALAGRDFELLERTSGQGAALVAQIRNRSEALRRRLAGLPGFGQAADFVLSPQSQQRHAAILDALEATDGLALAWARLTNGGLAAARVSTLLALHDERITDAIDAGRASRFDEALETIDAATAALDETTKVRDQLANNVDVATLDEWLRRNRAYDEALHDLYEASAASPDRITPAIRAALRAEQAARDQLPRTTNALTIVMEDIGRGGLNQAVITIETARGDLADALATLGGTPPPTG